MADEPIPCSTCVSGAMPQGYMDWHWLAEERLRAGYLQTQCPECGLWRYQDEFRREYAGDGEGI